MANKFPLQAGDVAPDFSERDASMTGDKREPVVAPVSSFNGVNASGDGTHSPIWKAGQVAPISKHSPPYAAIHTEGDTSGDGTVLYPVDVYSYGDCYDPHAPTRVREVASEWKVDTDFDSSLN